MYGLNWIWRVDIYSLYAKNITHKKAKPQYLFAGETIFWEGYDLLFRKRGGLLWSVAAHTGNFAEGGIHEAPAATHYSGRGAVLQPRACARM